MNLPCRSQSKIESLAPSATGARRHDRRLGQPDSTQSNSSMSSRCHVPGDTMTVWYYVGLTMPGKVWIQPKSFSTVTRIVIPQKEIQVPKMSRLKQAAHAH
jgi:hypothetical protein